MLQLRSLPASLPICPAPVIMRLQSSPHFETFGVGRNNNLVLSWPAFAIEFVRRKLKWQRTDSAATDSPATWLVSSARLTAGCCGRRVLLCVTAACQLKTSIYFSFGAGSESSRHKKMCDERPQRASGHNRRNVIFIILTPAQVRVWNS